jgi:predicted amidohydrolase YtcJ
VRIARDTSLLADLLLINGHIYTMDPGWPWPTALAVSGDRILAVGDDLSDLLAPGGRVVDLHGACVTPGLIDSHIHFTSYALGLRELDLSQTASIRELQSLLSQRREKTGAGRRWILGHGWDQERWPERRFPSAADLDAAVADTPVLLRAKSGHAVVTNSLALRIAGISSGMPDPRGGRIGRDTSR